MMIGIPKLLLIGFSVIADNISYNNFFKNEVDLFFVKNLKTAHHLFTEHGVDDCRIIVEKLVTGKQIHIFFCIKFEGGGNSEHELKAMTKILDDNYAHIMCNSDIVNIPFIPYT